MGKLIYDGTLTYDQCERRAKDRVDQFWEKRLRRRLWESRWFYIYDAIKRESDENRKRQQR